MRIKWFAIGFFFLGMVAGSGPFRVSAAGDPLASPTPRPTQRVAAPAIVGVNPAVVLPEGEQGEIAPSGGLIQAQPVPLPWIPSYIDPAPQNISVQKQEHNFESISCGPASLSAALGLLGFPEDGPVASTSELSDWMESRGLMYSWGTGVEELAYAARGYGLAGSSAVHDWSWGQLADELTTGRPVVVSLGVNGENHPGHFLTATGISPGGDSITCLDPSKGEVRFSREEFLQLWEAQGRSGVVLRRESLPAPADPMLPWMGLLGAVSALALSLGKYSEPGRSGLLDGLRRKLADPSRKGIGAGYLDVDAPRTQNPNTSRAGMKIDLVEIPIYETRMVKVGMRGVKTQEPVYEIEKVFDGVRKDIQRVPVYTTKKVRTGTRWVTKDIKVTRYRNQKVQVWKYVTERVPVTRWLGSKRIVIGYRNQTRRKRVWTTRKVPYQAEKAIRVPEPVYRTERVQTGWKTITRWVPKFTEKQVLVRHRTVYQTEPVYEKRRVKVGTRLAPRPVLTGKVVPDNSRQEHTQGPDDAGMERMEAAKGLKLKKKLIPEQEEEKSSIPKGMAEAVWDSLSNQDQTRMSQSTPEWFRDQVELENIEDSWLVKAYNQYESTRDWMIRAAKSIGLPRQNGRLPHPVSLTTNKHVDGDIFSEEGIVVDTYQPPNLLNLLYIQQIIEFGIKTEITAFHPGLFDLNLSSRTISFDLGRTNIFVGSAGGVGFSYKLDKKDSLHDEIRNKYSLEANIDGISYQYKKEGYFIQKDEINDLVQIKTVDTLLCKNTVIKWKGLAVLAGLGVLIYFLSKCGLSYQIPKWLEIMGFSL